LLVWILAFRHRYPNSFWADPDAFFTDGPLLNVGSDFALMPSLFEPSGVVQQEYFAAGTPVIAFKTGGLKDTVYEYSAHNTTGNGFTFESHDYHDFVNAVGRALTAFSHEQVYEKIRDNAAASVLDTKVVAEEWAKEFARLRNVIWIRASE
jgi:starch synthase